MMILILKELKDFQRNYKSGCLRRDYLARALMIFVLAEHPQTPAAISPSQIT